MQRTATWVHDVSVFEKKGKDGTELHAWALVSRGYDLRCRGLYPDARARPLAFRKRACHLIFAPADNCGTAPLCPRRHFEGVSPLI